MGFENLIKSHSNPTKYFLILQLIIKVRKNLKEHCILGNSLSRQKTTTRNDQIKRGQLLLQYSIKLSLKSLISGGQGGELPTQFWVKLGLGCQNRKSRSCFSACPSRFEMLPTPKDLELIFIRGQLSLYIISCCGNLLSIPDPNFLFKSLSMYYEKYNNYL